jgi:murein L,D-transpeptidase YcbB/YkuD
MAAMRRGGKTRIEAALVLSAGLAGLLAAGGAVGSRRDPSPRSDSTGSRRLEGTRPTALVRADYVDRRTAALRRDAPDAWISAALRRGITGSRSLLTPEFYARRNFVPAWSVEGRVGPGALSLLKAVCAAADEALNPRDYRVDRIAGLLAAALRSRAGPSPDLLADLDLLLTDAFFLYASHLARGKVDQETVLPEWAAPPRDEDLLGRLESVTLGRESAESVLRCLAPSHPSYRRLLKAREDYRSLAARGGWPAVPEGPGLRPGDKGKRVKALRARLLAGGDLGVEEAGRGRASVYSEELAAAVAKSQKRHGLAVTGEADGATLVALAVPVETRLRQIEANIERWRWLRHELGTRHIIVNIADFHLEAVEDGATSFRMKIVVGNASWQTPGFSADLTYFVVNPFWNTPGNVLARELINYIRADPKYLEANGMTLLRPSPEGEREMLREDIDWRAVDRGRINFRLRQNPGPANVLGRVKFMLPNPYDVYLHDTPYQEDFGQSLRAFSHGCIRIEKPLDLALWLVAGDRRRSAAALREAFASAIDLYVKLRERLPVHVTYATAWADADGTVEFREDVYGRDEPLRAALEAPPPDDRAPMRH